MKDEQILIAQAIRLVTLGYTLDGQQAMVERLLTEGHKLSSDVVVDANRKLEAILSEWYGLEAEHLKLRDRISQKRSVLQ